MTDRRDYWNDVDPVGSRRLFSHSKLSETQSARFQMGATRLGIPLEMYELHREQGELWCSHHQQWESQAEFGSQIRRGRVMPATVCYQAARDLAKAVYYRRHGRGTP